MKLEEREKSITYGEGVWVSNKNAALLEEWERYQDTSDVKQLGYGAHGKAIIENVTLRRVFEVFAGLSDAQVSRYLVTLAKNGKVPELSEDVHFISDTLVSRDTYRAVDRIIKKMEVKHLEGTFMLINSLLDYLDESYADKSHEFKVQDIQNGFASFSI